MDTPLIGRSNLIGALAQYERLSSQPNRGRYVIYFDQNDLEFKVAKKVNGFIYFLRALLCCIGNPYNQDNAGKTYLSREIRAILPTEMERVRGETALIQSALRRLDQKFGQGSCLSSLIEKQSSSSRPRHTGSGTQRRKGHSSRRRTSPPREAPHSTTSFTRISTVTAAKLHAPLRRDIERADDPVREAPRVTYRGVSDTSTFARIQAGAGETQRKQAAAMSRSQHVSIPEGRVTDRRIQQRVFAHLVKMQEEDTQRERIDEGKRRSRAPDAMHRHDPLFPGQNILNPKYYTRDRRHFTVILEGDRNLGGALLTPTTPNYIGRAYTDFTYEITKRRGGGYYVRVDDPRAGHEMFEGGSNQAHRDISLKGSLYNQLKEFFVVEHNAVLTDAIKASALRRGGDS